MLVIGTFEHSLELEQVLAILEEGGVPRRRMLVTPLDTDGPSSLRCSGSPSEAYSRGVEAGMALATACCVVGTSIGFSLAWGPIVWGIAGGFFGFIVGLGFFVVIRKGKPPRPEKLPEVTVIIQCPESQSTSIVDVMWQYGALSVGRAPEPADKISAGNRP